MKNMKNNKHYRHGDLNIIPVDIDISKLKKLNKGNSFILAEGEATGHFHNIVATKGKVDVYEGKNGEIIISVNGKAVLTHPEHKTLEFTTGMWTVKREQEFDYFAKAKRQVID